MREHQRSSMHATRFQILKMIVATYFTLMKKRKKERK